MPKPEGAFGLPKTVVRLGLISLFADICSEMAYPVLPLFLTGVLKAPTWALGAIEGIAEATVSFMKVWSGRWSDKSGKRVPFIQWGYALSAIGKPIIGFAAAWPAVLFARVLDRFGKGLRTTARDAMIADSVDPSLYGKAFGLHRALDTAGAFLGVLIALVMLWFMPGQYRLVLVAAIVPGIFSVFLTLLLRDPRSADQVHEQTRQVVDSTWKDTLRQLSPSYWRAFGLSIVFGLANTSDAFLLLKAKALGMSDSQTILAYIVYNLVVTLLATWAGSISDRVGRWKVLFVAWLLYGVVYAGFAFSTATWIWILFGLYGIYYALGQGVNKALVADHSPAAFRGSAMGFFYFASGIATIVANLVMGTLWDVYSPKAALLTSACLALAAALLIPLTMKLSRTSSA